MPFNPSDTSAPYDYNGRRYVHDGVGWRLQAAPPSVNSVVHAAPAKSPPVDSDEMMLVDSEASWGLKRVSISILRGLFKTISGAVLNDGFVEQMAAAVATTASTTVSLAGGSTKRYTLAVNTTFVFPTGMAAGTPLTLFLTQDSTGSRTVAWPSSVRWPEDTNPTITGTAGRTTGVTFVFDGTYWIGGLMGANYRLAA